MIDFEIDISKPTPYKEVLDSLREQSHALKTIHNPKTWCLSALTYALHLNDCMVLFNDLKQRWSQELPFAEAWDVNFRQWKNDIWSAVQNTNSQTQNNWKSLCDTDYAQFITLSHKFVEGEIPITPLLDFVQGKDSDIAKIIVDVGGQLSKLFTEIDNMLNQSNSILYNDFFSNCIVGYNHSHSVDLHNINLKSGSQPYDNWAASKTSRKLPTAIESLIKSIVKEISDNKTWGELWEECYSDGKIDHEGIARHIFINRNDIIGNRQYAYKDSLDRLFYTVTMVEFLSQKLAELRGTATYVQPAQQSQSEVVRDGVNTTINNYNITIGTNNGTATGDIGTQKLAIGDNAAKKLLGNGNE